MELDKEDRFYEIKLQTIEADRKSSLEATENFQKKLNKKKKRKTLHDYDKRKHDALSNQRVKSLIDFHDEYSASIKSIAIEKSSKINLTTRFLNGKMLMFSKVSVKSFAYDLIEVFLFPNAEIQKIYDEYQINQCYLDQNLTDTDSASMFFVFLCNLQSNISEDKMRNVIFEIMLKSKLFDRLDLSAEYFKQFNCHKKDLRKQVGVFEIENINKPNIITIALNPKEYYERFIDHSDNKKHKGLKKSTPDMDFDSYSARLSDLTEYYGEFLKPGPQKIEQKRFQVINESTQMKSMSQVQFGQLNDKIFYFCDGMSLPYGCSLLENLREEKHKYRNIDSVIQSKKNKFLKEESKVIKKIPN